MTDRAIIRFMGAKSPRNIARRETTVRPISVALVSFGLALAAGSPAAAESLDSFALIAGSEITNTAATTISGNIALYPGTLISGTGTISLSNGVYHKTDAVAQQAKSDLTSAYNVLFGLTGTVEPAAEMAGLNFAPGVHTYNGSASLNGTLTLTGNASSVFVIQVASDFITGTGAKIDLQGGALASNVFFVVGNSVTLGSATEFQGTIMALTSIVFDPAATIECGAAFTQVGNITLINNTITKCDFAIAPTDTSDGLDSDASDAAKRLADAIDDFVTNGGTLPLSFAVLSLLSPEDLAIALEQISGEIGSSVAPAGLQSVDSFMSQVAADHSMSRPPEQPAAPDTVSVMGYAAPPSAPGGSAFTSFGLSDPTPPIENWRVWSSAYGGVSEALGDAGAGTHDLSIADFGLAIGFERNVSADTLFGFAVSAGGTNFDLSDSLGSGRSAMLQAAIYAQRDVKDAYFSGALSYGAHAVHTSRTLTVGGEDRFSSDFIAEDVSGQVEAGYHMGRFTPYASIRGSLFYTPAYSEVTESGVSTFALDYDESTTVAIRTEIGARANWSHEVEAGSINLMASAAWVHQNWSGTGQQATFQMVEGLSFSVDGATSSSDAIVYAVGADMAYDNGFSLGASLGGATSDSVTKYAGDAHLSYSW